MAISEVDIKTLPDGPNGKPLYRARLLRVSAIFVLLLALLFPAGSVQVCARHDPHGTVRSSAATFVDGIDHVGVALRASAKTLASSDVGRCNLFTGLREHWFRTWMACELDAQRVRDGGMVRAVLACASQAVVAALLIREPAMGAGDTHWPSIGECWWLMGYWALAALAGTAAATSNYFAAMYAAAAGVLGRSARNVRATRFALYARAKVVRRAHATNLEVLRAAPPSPLGDLLEAALIAQEGNLPSVDDPCRTESFFAHFDKHVAQGEPVGSIWRGTVCPHARAIDTMAVLATTRTGANTVVVTLLTASVPLSAHLPALFAYPYSVGHDVPVNVPPELRHLLPPELRQLAEAGPLHASFAHRSTSYRAAASGGWASRLPPSAARPRSRRAWAGRPSSRPAWASGRARATRTWLTATRR